MIEFTVQMVMLWWKLAIHLCDLYNVQCTNGKKVSSVFRSKLNAWKIIITQDHDGVQSLTNN